MPKLRENNQIEDYPVPLKRERLRINIKHVTSRKLWLLQRWWKTNRHENETFCLPSVYLKSITARSSTLLWKYLSQAATAKAASCQQHCDEWCNRTATRCITSASDGCSHWIEYASIRGPMPPFNGLNKTKCHRTGWGDLWKSLHISIKEIFL